MNRLCAASVAAVAWSLFVTTSALAATYYVDQNHPAASDSNPGTEALPWKTLAKAAAAMYPGDTTIAKAGIYRERFGVGRSGTETQPITLKGAPGQRVVLSGAGLLTGWAPCTEAIAKDNPNYASIYYVDIAWKATSLYQDEQPLVKARVPNSGWWIARGGTTTTLVDSVNLTQPDDYWVGAEIFLWDTSITAQYTRDITDFDSATSTLTVASAWNGTQVPQSGADRYYLRNKVELIDVEGEWATEEVAPGTWRVYVWPVGGGNPDAQGRMMEASKQTRFLIELGNKGYWVVDGLELRHCQSHGVGGWSSGGSGHNVVQNCSIHHNEGTGIYGRYNDYGVYRRNFVAWNSNGIANVGSTNVTVEENEVCFNTGDGVLMTGQNDPYAVDVVLRRNYIHDHFMWGHPDNIQTYDGVHNLLLEDNLIINAVQDYMMEECQGTIYRGNTIVGASAYMIILGHENTFDTTFEHNTLLGGGWGMVAHSANGYAYRNNIVVMGHPILAWSVESDDTYTADYNLYYHGDGISAATNCIRWHGTNRTFPSYVSTSGQDTHGQYADPLFVNAPATVHPLDGPNQVNFLPNRVYLRSSSESYLISVGDHIELDFDGIVRTVTAVGSTMIEFTPPDPRIPLKSHLLINWKDNADFRLDLSPAPGSPALGAADDGGNLGSSIPMRQFIDGDFTGDHVRDIPVWPYQPPPVCEIRSWQVVAGHGGADLATEFDTTAVYPSVAGATRLRLVFGAPVDASTVNASSLTIVGAASGDQSALIASVALSDYDRAITVTLSAPLPDADVYALTLAGTVRAGDGTDVQGDLSQTLRCLAGDADGSGAVGAADLLAIRAAAGRTVDADTARFDVDGSGNITTADMAAARPMIGNALP
ncbi:MAG TPA: right-handed parallel beta-helix repeat-containing protein [Phycisphaerae bacterium]|nr:right-handed parallel beta-helix repeat-containing protein [Phycisphaerae bacterium]